MSLLVDRCIFTPVSGGTGDFVVNAAVVGYQTPAQANAVNGVIYSYAAQSGDLSQWEIGQGTYTAGTTTLTRAKVLANSSGTTALINFGNPPQVTLTALAEDLSSSGVINIGDIVPLVGDGITDNTNSFRTFAGHSLGSGSDQFKGRGYGKTAGPPSLPTVVTLTMGSPGVVNWTGHGLRVDETVIFSTTGALPTGLVAGVPYFVMFTNLTANSFQVSTVSAITNWTTGAVAMGAPGGDGPAVNFTGSQSGTQSAQTLATEWQQTVLAPGAYHNAGFAVANGAQKRLIFSGYGAVSDDLQFGPTINFSAGYGGYASGPWVGTPFASVGLRGGGSITLLRTADAAKFWVGGWVCLGALDLQCALGLLSSWPPNCHYFEFLQVKAIDYGAGVLTFVTHTQNGYRSDFPDFIDGQDIGGPPSNTLASGGGPATVYAINPEWDMEIVCKGLHFNHSPFQDIASARSIKFIDCRWSDAVAVPSSQRSFVMEHCVIDSGIAIEIDKLVEYLRFSDCDFGTAGLLTQSSSIDTMVVEGCVMASCGSVKNTFIRDSHIDSIIYGVFYGYSENLLIENCRVTFFAPGYFGEDAGNFGVVLSTMVNNFTFTNGVLSQPLATNTGINAWAVPGRRMWVNDCALNFISMGSPFTILAVYQSQAAQSVVTISIANPAVISWNSHGRSAGDTIVFTTTGFMPTGVYTTTAYYVLAAGLTTNTFEVSISPGGSPVVTTGTQSGTHTANANPTINIATTLPAVPVGISTNSAVTISIASPAVITWNSHGLTANTPVAFITTGSLPTGIDTRHLYYVLATGLTTNTFEVSTSVGGAAVNTSGTQSGTQTAVANPLKYQPAPLGRLTVRNCTGCGTIEDASNAPDGLAPFSFASRRFGGMQVAGASSAYSPGITVYGKLVNLTINVEKAYTGAGGMTMNVSCPAFNNLIESDLNITIDLTLTGIRVITPAAATGAQGLDSIAAFSNWLTDGIAHSGLYWSFSIGGDNIITHSPIVSLTVTTDQGQVAPMVFVGGGNPSAGPETFVDTTMLHVPH